MSRISTIAELLVKIGGDNSGLKKSLADSEASVQKAFSANPIQEFTGALSGATSKIDGMIGKISGLAALTAGGFGLGALIEGAVNAGEATYQLTTRLGITAQEAGELSRILKLTGADSDSFATVMMRLDKSMMESGDGGQKIRDVLNAFGVALTDGNGKLLPLNQQLANMAKGYQLASEAGLTQEFIMNTLGVKGMSLVKTLKDYSEAAEKSKQVKGVGLNPQEMHELKGELEVVSMQARQVGLAFTGALAPVAEQLFPPIMTGLQATVGFLKENKAGVVELTKDTLELFVAYKSIQLLGSAGNAIAGFWRAAAVQAAASSAVQATSVEGLSIVQERAITRAIAASDKMYSKMQADAVKTAQAAGLSAEETAIIISEKCVEIANASTVAATRIRSEMTAAFLAQAQAAEVAAVGVTTALTAEGNAAVIAGEKTVAANEMAAVSAGTASVAEAELTAAVATQGNAAVLAGEKTVGAMATAKVAAGNFLSGLVSLAGGWLGVAIATGIAIKALADYLDGIHKVESYNPKAEVWDDTNRQGKHLVGRTVEGRWVDSPYSDIGGYYMPEHTERQPMTDAEEEEWSAWRSWRDKQENNKPWLQNGDGAGIDPDLLAKMQNALNGTVKTPEISHHGGTDGTKADHQLEDLHKKAQAINDQILKEYYAMNDSKIQAVSHWYEEEKRKLDESKEQNTAYDATLSQLEAIRAEKERKANAEMLASSTNIWLEAAKNARALHDTTSVAGMAGPQRELIEMNNKYNDSLAETEAKYKKLSVDFMNLDKESRTQYLAANPDVKLNSDGSLDFTKRINEEKLAIIKEYEMQVGNYHKEEKQYEYDLDQAMQSRSLSTMQAFLHSKAALEAKERSGQQAAMTAYYDLWKKANKSSMEIMAEDAGTFQQSLQNLFEGLGSNINKAGDLFRSFAQSISGMFMKHITEKLSAQITGDLFGSILGDGSGADKAQKDSSASLLIAGSTLTTAGISLTSAAAALSTALGVSQASGGSSSGTSLLTSFVPSIVGHFATGGIASGWSIVGEEGPELVNFTNPGRVYPASQTRSMLSAGNTYQTHVPISVAGGSNNPKLAGRLRSEVGSLVQQILYEESRR